MAGILLFLLAIYFFYTEKSNNPYMVMETEMYRQQYPIGEHQWEGQVEESKLNHWIEQIEKFPERLEKLVDGLTNEQLDRPYREGGWTIRQVVHHCADSHTNSIARFKLALTEDRPTIRPYYEARWAELYDSKALTIAPALELLKGLHKRWVALLKHLTPEQMKRTYIHPEHGKEFNVEGTIGLYAWHCNHHLAHISRLVEAKGW